MAVITHVVHALIMYCDARSLWRRLSKSRLVSLAAHGLKAGRLVV